MRFVRPIDWDEAIDAGIPDYRGHVMFAGESCYVIATKVPPGVEGPATHTHASDQIYFVLEGTTTVELGEDEYEVGKYGTVFIPAGLPHHNRNDGAVDEVHLEVIAPGGFLQPLGAPAESRESHGLPYRTRELPESGSLGGMAVRWLENRESGSVNASIYLAELAPGGSGPPTHVHTFDQFYFVLEGSLSVEVGLEHYEVGPNTLVVLPAGVPHHQHNARDDAIERHLAILVPEPDSPNSPEHPWDVGVTLELAEGHIS